MSNCSSETMQARRDWFEILKMLRKEKHLSRILYSTKLFFKNISQKNIYFFLHFFIFLVDLVIVFEQCLQEDEEVLALPRPKLEGRQLDNHQVQKLYRGVRKVLRLGDVL